MTHDREQRSHLKGEGELLGIARRSRKQTTVFVIASACEVDAQWCHTVRATLLNRLCELSVTMVYCARDRGQRLSTRVLVRELFSALPSQFVHADPTATW